MEKKDKKTILKYLCMALPYGVIVNTEDGNGYLCSIDQTIFGNEYGVNINPTKRDYFNDADTDIKPYLRSMYSMTEEEKKEYWDITSISNHCAAIVWLLEHHFDFMGLIEKDLALEAPEDIYNN